jgi:tRNA A-37 threonylcarbamoyl transferase component Bud32
VRGTGHLPDGFEWLCEGRLRAAVRSDLRTELAPLLRQWSRGTLPPGRSLVGGRGGLSVYDLSPDLAVVLRRYRRGGFVRHFNRDVYLDRRPRPFRELVVGETLRARGVTTLELLAACVQRLVLGYRGAILSREVSSAANLWQYARDVDAEKRVRVCAQAAAVTRRMHDAGVVHPDLNLQNFLVRPVATGVEVLVIDFDRARLRVVHPRDREAAVARLLRSVRRLDPQRQVITGKCISALRAIGEASECTSYT